MFNASLGKYSLEYKLHTKTVPLVGKIFILDNIEQVLIEAYGCWAPNREEVVFEVEAENPQKVVEKICLPNTYRSEPSLLPKFWAGEKLGYCESPKGTYLAASVTPIRQMTLKELRTLYEANKKEHIDYANNN